MQKFDLLPCPFCGSKSVHLAENTIEGHFIGYSVHCNGCGVENRYTKDKEKAINAWNTRASGLIQCSDMMPKKDGEYLCVINGEFKILPYRNGEFYCTCFDAVLRCCNSSVTHWMLLPQSPKE